MRGGYKTISFRDTPFVTGGTTMMLDGLYDEIESNPNKAILLVDLIIDGIEINEIYVNPISLGGTYRFPLNNNKSIIVTDTDAVSVVNG